MLPHPAAGAAEGVDIARTCASAPPGQVTAAELSSSFYRPHAEATDAAWCAQTLPDFCFSVKLPKAIENTAADHALALQKKRLVSCHE